MTVTGEGGASPHVAEAFAAHIAGPQESTALRLSHALHEIGETRRAELLRLFAERGQHTRPAPWWAADAVCHLSLDLPQAQGPGELWFDPLEVSIGLVEPWIRDPGTPPALYANIPLFHGWTTLDLVADWQLQGAHQIAHHIPAHLAHLTGEQADDYCKLFSKGITEWGSWSILLETYGRETCRRMWGSPIEQLGGFGPNEGEMEVLRLAEIHPGPPHENEALGEISDIIAMNLPFRTTASVQSGLWQGTGTLPRVWLG
ncbi:MAG: hypothetical protein ACK5MT_21970 [Actinomycetales bacterium]